MSLKKGLIENYFKDRDSSKIDTTKNSSFSVKTHKYSINRVFDEPESFKKLLSSKETQEKKLFSNQHIEKLETNLGQSEDKLRANLGQSEDKLKTNLGQAGNELETQLRTKLETNLGQSEDKLRTKQFTQKSFFSLSSLQRKILIFIHEQCKLCRDKITLPLSIEIISTHCNTTVFSARKTLQRLEKQHYIQRKEFKNGRGGWTRYELPKDVFQEILQYENYGQNNDKLRINLGQSEDKLETELRTELRTMASSSSSNIINTTTTELSEKWKKINFDELKEVGFTHSHLLQLYRCGNLDPEIIQDSINFFAYDLKSNNKAKEIKTNPLSYFMGILKRAGVYTAPENHESARDKAMRVYLNQQKTIKEKKIALENELMQLSYEEWINQLNEDEKNNLLPDSVKTSNLQAPKTIALKSYYEKNIWPERKTEVLKNI